MMNMCNGQTNKVPMVRPATQANRFYTGDAKELSEEVDSLLALHRGETVYRDVAALIVPHAGYYFSGNVAAAAYMAMPKDKQYKRIFLLGPSHHEWLDGASVNTEADYYATPLGQVKVDRETAVALTAADFSLSEDEKRMLKEIALTSIKDSLDGKPISHHSPLTSHLSEKCGAFVSLHKHGRLRGCIGHFGEDVPLHEIVAEMARAAAFEDPRFMPVTADELSDIDIEISVLTPMRRILSLDEFELHRHGIYIRKGYRSGTYLPQVADEVNWTKEEFVSHCAQDKAGIGWDGWKDAETELYVYEAIVF